MNTKPFFLPSEVARLVLGYLISEGYSQTSRLFLIECECLEEYRKLKTMGLEYPTNILGLSLVEILDNFGFMKTQALERYNAVAATDLLWKDMDSCIDKLKYRMLQTGASKINVSKIRSQRKFPDRNVKVLPENIGEMILKQGKILSSKQIAQTIKKVHETMKDPQKENQVESTSSSSADTHLMQNINSARQNFQRALSNPVCNEEIRVEIRDTPTTSVTSNIMNQNEMDVEVIYDSNQETVSDINLDAPCNTESISDTSSRIQVSHASDTGDNLPTLITRTTTKQPELGNTIACITPLDRHVSSHSAVTQTVTAVPKPSISQPSVSESLPSESSNSACHPHPIGSKPIYQSIGTQSDFSPVPSPIHPNISSNEPYDTALSEKIHSTSTKAEVPTPSQSSRLILQSTPNLENSQNANPLSSTMVADLTSDEIPEAPHDVSTPGNKSADSFLKNATTAAATLCLSTSPTLIGFPSGDSSKTLPSVYKTPVKARQNPSCTPRKGINPSDTLNTPTRGKNTSFPEAVTPSKMSEADLAKSKRKRFPPEKRDIPVPGPSQVRSESGNSQDSCHSKDPIPTFVEKVITETSLPKFLAETINRKLYGEAISEVTTKSSENKPLEVHKAECDKLMDEIMLTDFHMTKNDIDEVILETNSAGIPVLDDLLKLFASVSEEKDNLSGDDCNEPVYDGVEFEGLDSCSQSADSKEIKEDDLSKSDLKTSGKPPTFLQVVDKLCTSEASTESSSNPASEDLSQKSFSVNPEHQEQKSENPTPKTSSTSESSITESQNSQNMNSSENPKQDQASTGPKEVPVPKQPSPRSRRSKVFSKGKSRRLVPAPVLESLNENSVSLPPNSTNISSGPVLSSSSNAISSNTCSQTSKSINTSLASNTHSNITTSTSISTNNDINITSSSISRPINTIQSTTSPTKLASSSSSNNAATKETGQVTISSDLPAMSTPTVSASSSNTVTTTTTTMASATSVIQTSLNSSAMVSETLSSAQTRPVSKIFSASIAESSSVVSKIIQPEIQTVAKYPVMYIIAPHNMPLQYQPSTASFVPTNTPFVPLNMPVISTNTPFIPNQTPLVPNKPLQIQPSQTITSQAGSNIAGSIVQWPSTVDTTALGLQSSNSLQTDPEASTVQETAQGRRGRTNQSRARGRPKKVPKEPTQRKIYNIAPNKAIGSLASTITASTTTSATTEPTPPPVPEKETLAVATDNSWSIEMMPGTEHIVLNLKSRYNNQVISYQLTADQVKDHLASFIGTSAITDQILRWMKKLRHAKLDNMPNILSPRRPRRKQTPKKTPESQPVVDETSGQTPEKGLQTSSSPSRNTASEEIQSSHPEEEEQVIFTAKPLGKVEDFVKKTRTETSDPKQKTDTQPSSAVIELVDSPASSVVECSPNPYSRLTKSTTDPETKDNEFLAINILSTLCYSQSEHGTKTVSSANVSQPKETTVDQSFYDAASPARCYKMLMGGKKEAVQVNVPPVETPKKSMPVLQEESKDKSSDSVETPKKSMPVLQEESEDKSSNSGHVSSRLRRTKKGTPEVKKIELEVEASVSSKEVKSVQKMETRGSARKKLVNKSPCDKIKRSTKRKLYEPEAKTPVKKINRTDIDLLLTRLHPDSLDGYD